MADYDATDLVDVRATKELTWRPGEVDAEDQVAWYVILWPNLLQMLLKFTMFLPLLNLAILPLYILTQLPKAGNAGLLDLDFFDLQDLKAYVTNAHHCVLDAVDKLLLELSQDPSKIERKSRGFLGIS